MNAFAKLNEQAKGDPPGQVQPAQLPTRFEWCDPLAIPPRPWVYGRHMMRKQVSVTVAPGGVGKSSLTIVEALAMVTGRELLDEWTAGPLNVWIFNLEDPRDELTRRITAAMMHHQIAPEALGGRLFVDTGRERGLCIGEETRDGATILRPVMDALEAEITARKIDVLIVDPFVSSHRVSENDNGAIDMVAKEWARLADRCDCAVELVHHTRKTNGAEATTEDGRGAYALLAAARSGRVLNRMSDEDRANAGVQTDPATYFAVTRDKANLAPAGKRVWRRMASVDLGQGDHVGVAEAWEWPDAFDGVTVADLLRLQQAIDGKQPRYSDQTADWAGHIVAEVLGLSAMTDRRRIKRLIAEWLKSGALVKGEGTTPNRKSCPTIEVGVWANDLSCATTPKNEVAQGGANPLQTGAPPPPPPKGVGGGGGARHLSPEVVTQSQPGNPRQPLTEGATLSPAQAKIAADTGLSAYQAAAAWDRFKDHALANGRTFANVDAAWRSWITSPHFKPVPPKAKGGEWTALGFIPDRKE